MLTIWTNKIKHSTVGSSFSVTFSVAPNELEYLNKLYDCFNSMHMSNFPITADHKTKDEPQTSGVVWTEDAIKNEPKAYTTWASTDEPQTDTITFTYTEEWKDRMWAEVGIEPQTERSE